MKHVRFNNHVDYSATPERYTTQQENTLPQPVPVRYTQDVLTTGFNLEDGQTHPAFARSTEDDLNTGFNLAHRPVNPELVRSTHHNFSQASVRSTHKQPNHASDEATEDVLNTGFVDVDQRINLPDQRMLRSQLQMMTKQPLLGGADRTHHYHVAPRAGISIDNSWRQGYKITGPIEPASILKAPNRPTESTV